MLAEFFPGGKHSAEAAVCEMSVGELDPSWGAVPSQPAPFSLSYPQQRQVNITWIRAEEMTQSIKCLLGRHQDLSLDPWHSHDKLNTVINAHNPSTEEAETGALGACLTTSVFESLGSKVQ